MTKRLILTKQIKQEITDFCNNAANFPFVGKSQAWYFDKLEEKLSDCNVQTSKDIEIGVKEMISEDEECPIRDGHYRWFLTELLRFVQTNL